MLTQRFLTRRELLLLLGAVPVAIACGSNSSKPAAQPSATAGASTTATATVAPSTPQALAPTPACGDPEDVTPEQTEGPYFTPNSPERASLLEPAMAGTKLTVSGRVLATDCTPIANALLDFWQANDAGEYDNAGYTLRGHQFSDADGRYSLATIVPGLYTGRTRHIHVKVQAPNQPILTTQLYFPDEPENANDSIFNPALLMAVQEVADGKSAAFDFVLA